MKKLVIFLAGLLAACSGAGSAEDRSPDTPLGNIELGRVEQPVSLVVGTGHRAESWAHMSCQPNNSSHSCLAPRGLEQINIWDDVGSQYGPELTAAVNKLRSHLDLVDEINSATYDLGVPSNGIRVRVHSEWFPSAPVPTNGPLHFSDYVHVYCTSGTYLGRFNGGAKYTSCNSYGIAIDFVHLWSYANVIGYLTPNQRSRVYEAAIDWGLAHAVGLPTTPGTGYRCTAEDQIPSDLGFCSYSDCDEWRVDWITPSSGIQVEFASCPY